MTISAIGDRMTAVQFTADQVMALLGLGDGTVNPPQAAVLLGISPRTVIRRVQSGDMQGFRFGEHSYRIPAAEVQAFISKSAVRDGDESGTDSGSDPDLVKHG